MDEKKREKSQKGSIASAIVLCISVLLCLIITIQILTKGYASVAGFSTFRVVTGSMEPTIPVGALVISKTTAIEDINVGDVVVFRAKVTAGAEKIITHRVVSRSTSGVNILLETQGDANPVSDSKLIGQDALIGRVVWYSESKGGVAGVIGFLSNKIGFLACIVFPILLIGGLILRESIRSIQRQLQEAESELATKGKCGSAAPAPLFSEEEYEELKERIRADLLKEIEQNAAETVEEFELDSQ